MKKFLAKLELWFRYNHCWKHIDQRKIRGSCYSCYLERKRRDLLKSNKRQERSEKLEKMVQ